MGAECALQAVFHDYITRVKNHVFTGAADVIMTRLSDAAEAVGDALHASLEELARKVRGYSLTCLLTSNLMDPLVLRSRSALLCCGRAYATIRSK